MQSVDASHEISQATALSNLGILEFADGRFEEAKKLLQESLRLRKNWFQRKQTQQGDTGGTRFEDSMEMVSLELSKDNRFCRIPNEQRILAKELKEHGAIDSVVADTINNLAACLEILGCLDEAKPLYEESLQLRKVTNLTLH